MGRKLALLATAALCILLFTQSAFSQAEDTYKAQCISCHGTDGTPSSAGKRLGAGDLKSRFVQNLTNDELFNSIAIGTAHKEYPHGFSRRGLTDQQIYELVDYIRQMPKRK